MLPFSTSIFKRLVFFAKEKFDLGSQTFEECLEPLASIKTSHYPYHPELRLDLSSICDIIKENSSFSSAPADDSSLEHWNNDSSLLDETFSRFLASIPASDSPDFNLDESTISEPSSGLKVSSLPVIDHSFETLEIL